MRDLSNFKQFLDKNYSSRVSSDIFSRIKKIEKDFSMDILSVTAERDVYLIAEQIEKRYFKTEINTHSSLKYALRVYARYKNIKLPKILRKDLVTKFLYN